MPKAGGDAAFVEFDRVQKSYDGQTLVVKDLNLQIPRGEFLTMLGPSGSGKTTCLMMLAGFETATHGEIRLGGRNINDVPPHKRGIGMVFQNYALFPHMSVAENLAFPLDVRGLSKADKEQKVRRALDMVQMGQFAHRRPAQLSGGQQQRIALARALARRPRVVLLDEPFSALDPELRVATRDAVAEALAHVGATVVLVTHDQGEALSFAHQVAIMHDGRFTQVGPPEQVYRAPADRRSAASLGDACFLPAEVAGGVLTCALGTFPVRDGDGDAGRCEVLVRPEQLRLGEPTASAACVADVTKVAYFGHDALVELRISAVTGSPTHVAARTPGVAVPAVGSRVSVTLDGKPHVLPATGTRVTR